MMRRALLTILGIVLMATGLYVMTHVAPTTSKGYIINYYPNGKSFVLFVKTGKGLYELKINATTIFPEKPVDVVFKNGKPVILKQDNMTYRVLKWRRVRTLERMPRIKINE